MDREVINSLRQPTNSVLANSHGRMRDLLLGAGIFAIAPGYAQDVASSEKIFVRCKACHQVGENAKNDVGPVLNGLFGERQEQLKATDCLTRMFCNR